MPLKKELESQITRQAGTITRQAVTIARQTDMLREKDVYCSGLEHEARTMQSDYKAIEAALREECMEALMDKDSQLLDRDETIRGLESHRGLQSNLLHDRRIELDKLSKVLSASGKEVARLKAKVGYAVQHVTSVEASSRAFAAMFGQESI